MLFCGCACDMVYSVTFTYNEIMKTRKLVLFRFLIVPFLLELDTVLPTELCRKYSLKWRHVSTNPIKTTQKYCHSVQPVTNHVIKTNINTSENFSKLNIYFERWPFNRTTCIIRLGIEFIKFERIAGYYQTENSEFPWKSLLINLCSVFFITVFF